MNLEQQQQPPEDGSESPSASKARVALVPARPPPPPYRLPSTERLENSLRIKTVTLRGIMRGFAKVQPDMRLLDAEFDAFLARVNDVMTDLAAKPCDDRPEVLQPYRAYTLHASREILFKTFLEVTGRSLVKSASSAKLKSFKKSKSKSEERTHFVAAAATAASPVHHPQPDLNVLSEWSLSMKPITYDCPFPTAVFQLTGTLISRGRQLMLEVNHDAGFLIEITANKRIVKTTKSFYYLRGEVVGGFPSFMYEVCKKNKIIPENWKQLIIRSYSVINEITTNGGYNITCSEGINYMGNVADHRYCELWEINAKFKSDPDLFVNYLIWVADNKIAQNKNDTNKRILENKFHRKFINYLKLINRNIIN